MQPSAENTKNGQCLHFNDHNSDYLTSQNGGEVIFNDWQSSRITEAIMKGIKELENIDLFVSIDPLELDDTIDRLHDYNSLPPEENIARFVT